ncbi:MAG: prepilin-type N-terminal cleavage/methylation domain-containing protein [Candidatus Aminicenantes bacterium]|nr:prepilin-type N-terminal cleavage/methylation domain-containing protein [Candidatus Aminicenantes bacterium]
MKFYKTSQKKFKAQGLTLVELLVVLALSALIILALVTLYTSGQRYFINQDAQAKVLREGRYVLDWIARDIKEGIQVVQTWNGYTTSTNCLILQVPAVDASGLIIDVANEFDYIIYRQKPEDPKRLERILDAKDGVSSRADSIRLLAERVDAFSLSSEGMDLSSVPDLSTVFSIDIALTTRQNRYGRDFQETLNTVVKLRNKPV